MFLPTALYTIFWCTHGTILQSESAKPGAKKEGAWGKNNDGLPLSLYLYQAGQKISLSTNKQSASLILRFVASINQLKSLEL
jgi:hypothetical protein